MKLCVLGSGSRGNAVLMESGDTRVLVDAGFAPRTLARKLISIGVHPRSISTVVVTHEHYDHVRGVAAGAAKWGWQIQATAGTRAEALSLEGIAVEDIAPGRSWSVGAFELTPIATSHDAAQPIGIVATSRTGGSRAAIVYDLGCVTESVQRALSEVEILVLESNHDGDMLRNGPYPASLKRRIAGRHGHLSNRAAADAAARSAHRGLAHVVLAHLSETNNTPRTALISMRAALRGTSFRGEITACGQDEPSPVFTLSRRSGGFAPVQLSLDL